jgi:hypothetical protein
LAQVVEVNRESFHGFVYNLDTGEGWYTASGVVCRNCRCTVVYEEAPVTAGADWWWSDDLTSAAWDESRVRRYPRGTRVEGPRGGGRFAPKESTAIENEAMGDIAPAGRALAALAPGERFYLGGHEYQVVEWQGDDLVIERAGEGFTRTLHKPAGMTEAT